MRSFVVWLLLILSAECIDQYHFPAAESRTVIKRSSGKSLTSEDTENDKVLSHPKLDPTNTTENREHPFPSFDLPMYEDVVHFPAKVSPTYTERKATPKARPKAEGKYQTDPFPLGENPTREKIDDNDVEEVKATVNLNSPSSFDPKSSSSRRGSTANWVIITIVATGVGVAVSIFFLSYIYRQRVVPTPRRHQKKNNSEPAGTETLMSIRCDSYEPSGEEVELESFKGVVPIRRGDTSKASLKDIEDQSTRSLILRQCISSDEQGEDHDFKKSASSIYNLIKHDGNKLRGGNSEFDRRYVDNPYVSDEIDVTPKVKPIKLQHQRSNSLARRKAGLKMSSPTSETGFNGSSASSTTSHHSARSYIMNGMNGECIPPTSPSEKYVEVASDCMSGQTERCSIPFKMEWLTKSFTLDSKNELSTYQTSTAVQTESSVTPPTIKTVFGTNWQFGGAFTSQGGVLQAGGSDVVLTVPPGAVSKGQAMDIYGAIFTDTLEIRKKLSFPSDESLVTPVVEYIGLPTCNFKRNVYLHLPHALPSGFDKESVKVYTFTVDDLGKVDISCIPFGSKSNTNSGGEAFWEKDQDESKICITTSHFSGYFCTLCKSSSLPSICTMVFGSHVQIEHQQRREIRVILYIWDRRLTIKDYLERFRKQESEVDRQLLTDMQVPLLNDASSDSRLVMRMEFLGNEDDSQCWRHVARPGGTRYLFKPLQVRRLSEIVQCCRQTDPIRVEWAVENKPDVKPGPIFQCCIDIMHAPESTCDYEAALNEDLDDLMRSFYVRDLKVTPRQDSWPASELKLEPTQLKHVLSKALNLQQTEQLCMELGFASKDIGNFHKKFSSESSVKVELVDECVRRLGPEKLSSKLPTVLDKLHLLHVLEALETETSSKYEKADRVTESTAKSNQDVNKVDVVDNTSSMTAQKLLMNEAFEGAHLMDKVKHNNHDIKSNENKNSPKVSNLSRNGKNCDYKRVPMQQQISEKSDDVFFPPSPSQKATSAKYAAGVSNGDVGNPTASYLQPGSSGPYLADGKLRSSSGYESVTQHDDYSAFSSVEDTLSNRQNNKSLQNFSVQAFADTADYPISSFETPPSLPSSQVISAGEGQAYGELSDELRYSTSNTSESNVHVQAGRTSALVYDPDQTSKKEMYGIHTVV